MEINDLGYGAGGGIISAILVALGFKTRMDKQDDRVNKLENTVMYKDTCFATHSPINSQLIRIEEKLDFLLTRRRDDRQNK